MREPKRLAHRQAERTRAKAQQRWGTEEASAEIFDGATPEWDYVEPRDSDGADDRDCRPSTGL